MNTKKVKGLKQQNLRDHMNDLELIFTIVSKENYLDTGKY